MEANKRMREGTEEAPVEHIVEEEESRLYHSLNIVIPCLLALVGLHFALGYVKQQQPTVEAVVIESTDKRIIYEYEVFGKTLRRLQKTSGVKEGLKKGDIITVHYLPKNPFLSNYKPPLFFVPFLHTSSAKEVEIVKE